MRKKRRFLFIFYFYLFCFFIQYVIDCFHFVNPTDPEKWSCSQVQSWLKFTLKQFKFASAQNIELIFNEDGQQLSSLNENDFINRMPQVCSHAIYLMFSFKMAEMISIRHTLPENKQPMANFINCLALEFTVL